MTSLERALVALDAVHANDPVRVAVGDAGARDDADSAGVRRELLHARTVTAWLRRLVVAPAPEQLLAASGSHLARWTFPRDAYPAGRAGYLRWRRAARAAHSVELSRILAECEVDADVAQRAAALVAKSSEADAAAAQAHEDALCLAFFELDAGRVGPALGDRAGPVIERTRAKMSERALSMLADLPG